MFVFRLSFVMMVDGGIMVIKQVTQEDIRRLWCIRGEFDLAHLNRNEYRGLNNLTLEQYRGADTIEHAFVAGFHDERHLNVFGIYMLYQQLKKTSVREIPPFFRVRQFPARRFIAGGSIALIDSRKYVLGLSFVGDDLHVIPPIALCRLNTQEHYFLMVERGLA